MKSKRATLSIPSDSSNNRNQFPFRVSECLKASEEVNNKLQSENHFLKELLDKHGIAYDCDGDITILS